MSFISFKFYNKNLDYENLINSYKSELNKKEDQIKKNESYIKSIEDDIKVKEDNNNGLYAKIDQLTNENKEKDNTIYNQNKKFQN